MDITDRTQWIGQILLSDKDERPLRHATSVDVALGGSHFGVGARQVPG
jgi:hypothetical protein